MKPTIKDGESIAGYLDRLTEWQEQGEWIPAANGTETPFPTRMGARLLYCWQPRSGRHAYLDCGTDMILTDAEARNLLGM